MILYIMKSSLYTRSGDDGTTSLVNGKRVKKNSVRIEAYGTIDELSSAIGLAASDKNCNDELRGQLLEIQNELFNIGSYLATEVPAGTTPGCKSLSEAKIKEIEGWIDALDEQTPKINSFILPGGSELASRLHVARVICRRAERRIIDLQEESYVDPLLTEYINRQSDYLFIAARYANFKQGVEEIKWKQ